MSVRTTIDIPDSLYAELRSRAATDNTSIRALVIGAIESRFGHTHTRIALTGPPIQSVGKPGPESPDRENPYDVLFN